MRHGIGGGWRRLVLALPLLLAGVFGNQARAGPVDINAVTVSQALVDSVSILLDPDGALAPQEAVSSSGVPADSQRALQFGFTSDTIWLKIPVRNSAEQDQTRWLSVGDARLEYVDVYRYSADGGRRQASWSGGTARPLASRPIPGKESLFPIALSAGEEAVLLIRIRGRAMIAINAVLWDPTHYRQQEAKEDLRRLLPAAVVLAFALSLLLYSLHRRDKALVFLALWVCSAILCQLAMQGYLYRFLLNSGGEVVVRAPLFLLSASLALSAAFFHTFLSGQKASVLGRFLRGTCRAGLALAIAATLGELRLVAIVFLVCVVLLCLAYPFLLVSVWRRLASSAGLFALALSGLWASVVARMLMMLDLVQFRESSSDLLSMVFAVSVACVALLGLVRHTLNQRNAELSQQNLLLEEQRKEKKRLESAIDARTRALQQAMMAANEANRAKTDFLTRISHDLRAPLTAILGYADLIIGSRGAQADNGRVIHRSAKHLLGLLNDLIDYARGSDQPNALQPRPVYAISLLKSIAAEGRSLARRNNNHFTYEVQCELPAVIEVDEKRLRQILINILDNAAKFTRNGQIRFSIQRQGQSDGPEEPPFSFVIEDDGLGMVATDLQHIFEPFARLKATESHEGIGLGLAIARQWVDRMGGHIDVESRPGLGTCVRVMLPLEPASEDELPAHHLTCEDENSPEFDGGGRKVWVVEDSHELRNLLCLELRSQNLIPIPIANGLEALDRLASPEVRAPDLVLTDLNMPFAGGTDVLVGVRERWPELPVAVVTGTPEAAESRPDGFSAILDKPISLVRLRQVLAELLGLPLSEPVSEHAQSIALVYPTSDVLDEARSLIRMGAVSDLIEWAERLAARNTAWSQFAEHAMTLAEQGDLEALQRLCAQDAARPETAASGAG